MPAATRTQSLTAHPKSGVPGLVAAVIEGPNSGYPLFFCRKTARRFFAATPPFAQVPALSLSACSYNSQFFNEIPVHAACSHGAPGWASGLAGNVLSSQCDLARRTVGGLRLHQIGRPLPRSFGGIEPAVSPPRWRLHRPRLADPGLGRSTTAQPRQGGVSGKETFECLT